MIKIGCCGFPTSMKKYYEKFRLVELNSTFYEYPRESTMKRWKEKAPENFEFTVKAHQDISHKFKLRGDNALKAFERMKQICTTLGAHILLIQTPGSLKTDALDNVKEFFHKIEREKLVIVWETRGPSWEKPEIRKRLAEVLEELNISHVTDPFKVMPVYIGKTAYFRLHGLGERMYYYQYTDEELKKLYEIIKPLEKKGKDVYVLFNNLSMFIDGLRFMEYIQTGEFPSVTGAVGIESIKRVIERTKYPATKTMLLKKVGWKLVEVEEGKQVRLYTLLKGIPSKTYHDAEELLKEIRI